MSHSLQVYVHGVNHLKDVEHFGKNSPYVQFSVDIQDKTSFTKTAVKKRAGDDVDWNETLTIDNFAPSQHHTLYVEVLDHETLADAVIGYAAIPLHQVAEAQGHIFKGKFDLFTSKGEQKGTIDLTIADLKPGQDAHNVSSRPEEKGKSQIDTDHQTRIKSLVNKEHLSEGAGAAAALLAAAGIAVGAKYVADQHKKAGHTEP
ncbi:hypothetical protein BGX26_004093 [Mortierella sp. AD094]|nr:hypothetical protein BGX26_004093 [Mortierella sp. AD094]